MLASIKLIVMENCNSIIRQQGMIQRTWQGLCAQTLLCVFRGEGWSFFCVYGRHLSHEGIMSCFRGKQKILGFYDSNGGSEHDISASVVSSNARCHIWG